MSLSIGVILGSSRPGRAGEAVGNWFMAETKKYQDLTFNFFDLAKIQLPMFDEPIPPLMHQYQNDHTKQWAESIDAQDGFIIITPEYNHRFPAVLKNAFDYVNAEWNRKPITYVSYGAISGGLRAVEQLRLVAIELHMVPIREQISIPIIWEAAQDNNVKPEFVKGEMDKMMSDLKWWAEVLKDARAKK
jgi:NAD(P)H-dependent FMN reductase